MGVQTTVAGRAAAEMLSLARLRSCIEARPVWKAINYPIFIPEGNSDIADLLVRGEVGKLVEMLKRRISLGSAPAAALLGYLEFMGAISGTPDSKAALTCCIGAAKAGDPYAQYVLAWAHWDLGNRDEALRWMKRPAAAAFLPAVVDTGRMLALLADNAGELRTAVGILWGAHKFGHVVPLVAISGIAIRGQLGLIQRLLGLVLAPYAVVRLMLRYRCEPFAIRSFSIDRRPNVPFFRPAVPAD